GTVMRGDTGRLQVCGRPARQRGRLGISGPQFAAIADRLFEVVAENLGTAGERVRQDILEPVTEAVVQLGTNRLGDRVVSRLQDEDVPEAVLCRRSRAGWPALHQALG